MEDDAAINKAFNELVTTEQFGVTEREVRIQCFSADPKLVAAVYDECIARVEYTFPFGGDLTADYEKNLRDANERVVAITEQLRHKYGLSEKDARCALELARVDALNGGDTSL